MNTITELSKAAFVAVALLSASLAFAGPSVASQEIKTAFAKFEEGPDALRRYVQRTKTIYALDYGEVLEAHAKVKAAEVERSAVARAFDVKVLS